LCRLINKKFSQLSADCLNNIFEYLEDDVAYLYSYNRLWYEISVNFFEYYKASNLRTLFSYLPYFLFEGIISNLLENKRKTANKKTNSMKTNKTH